MVKFLIAPSCPWAHNRGKVIHVSLCVFLLIFDSQPYLHQFLPNSLEIHWENCFKIVCEQSLP